MANDMRNGGQNSEPNRARRRSFTSIGRAIRRPGARTRETLGQRPRSNSVAGQTVQSKTPEAPDTRSQFTRQIQAANGRLVEQRKNKLSAGVSSLTRQIEIAARRLKEVKADSKRIEMSDKELVKNAEDIFAEYSDACRKVTINFVEEFWILSASEGLKPLNRYNVQKYRQAFDELENFKMPIIGKERKIKKTFELVAKLTGQLNLSPDAFMELFLTFTQMFLKLQLLLRDMIKQLRKLMDVGPNNNSQNSERIFAQIKGICGELEKYLYDDVKPLIDAKKLNNREYLSECISKLSKFSYEVVEMGKRMNRQNTLDRQEKIERLMALHKRCCRK